MEKCLIQYIVINTFIYHELGSQKVSFSNLRFSSSHHPTQSSNRCRWCSVLNQKHFTKEVMSTRDLRSSGALRSVNL